MTTTKILPLAAVIFLLVAWMPSVAAQSDDGAATGCGPVESAPCIVVIPFAVTAALFLFVLLRVIFLARRIRRGPARAEDDDGVPPDLRHASADIPQNPPSWSDEDAPTDGRRSLVREGPTEQIMWGDHRLWFDGTHYQFRRDVVVPDDWLPCFVIPKGHRIVVGADRIPRLERVDPRIPKGQQ